jgi:ketosteroid isomerase-like protein
VKNILIFVACLVVAFLPSCNSAPRSEAVPEPQFDQNAEEAAIRTVLEQLLTAYNNHDAKTYVSLLTETHESWEGGLKGRAAWERYLTEYFEDQEGTKANPGEEIGLFFVTPEVAIYKGRAEFTGDIDEDGKPLPATRTLVAMVFVKKNEKWLRAAWLGKDE